jgi:hypothetical protein
MGVTPGYASASAWCRLDRQQGRRWSRRAFVPDLTFLSNYFENLA